MKIAVVHDWLNTRDGGAEAVLRDILALYPGADVFTLVYNKRKFADIAAGHQIKTSSLQRWLVLRRQQPLLLPGIRRAISHLDLTGYDLIISSSGAWSKNITVPNGARHICYCHSPARMIWSDWPAYLDSPRWRGLRFVPFGRLALLRLCSRLRVWDYYGTAGVDALIANSNYVAGRIHKFYGRDSQVIYPGIDVAQYQPASRAEKEDFYLVLSTLARYKNIDTIIAAIRTTGRRLVIAGDGPDRARLERRAAGDKQIEFRGYVSDADKRQLLRSARGLIFNNIEDFGLTPVEALASGTPVIALSGGGLSETVRDGINGIIFAAPTTTVLSAALRRFETKHFEPVEVAKTAQQFHKTQFATAFARVVKDSR